MRKILILLAVLAAANLTSAASINEMENQKALYEKAADESKQRADWLQGKINSVSEVKRALDEEAAVYIADYEKKQAALDETLKRIEENELKQLETERDYERKRQRLEKRIRDIYINGQISYIDVMFGAHDFGDFLTRMDLLKHVLVNDSELVNSALQYKYELDELAAQLDEDRDIRASQARFAEKAKLAKEKKVAEQQALIDRMENDKTLYNQRYDEMMAASKEVERLIQESKYKLAAEAAAKEQAAQERAAKAERERVAREQRALQEKLEREQLAAEQKLARDLQAAEQKAAREQREAQQKADREYREAKQRADREYREAQQRAYREEQRAYREEQRAHRDEQRAYREEQRAHSNMYADPREDKNVYVPEGTGEMMWPIVGPITSEFGWRTHPIFGGSKFHSGVDIGGDYGMEIRAARGGVVSHSGWIDGYGNTVMIDHGGGLVTLYGHNQSLAVEVGQKVRQGQVIAYCGSTGNSTGPHCHFEVRKNGEPVSPFDYL